MKIIIECNKVEQKKWIDNTDEVPGYCVFEEMNDVDCSFDKNCKDCLLKNIEWHINDERACYACGKTEDENNLLNIHTLPYLGNDVLICDDCYSFLRERAQNLEKQFGGDLNEND